LLPTSEGGFETSLITRTYRVDFTANDLEVDTLLKAFGCMVMSAMPPSGIESAVQALVDTYDFAFEDATLETVDTVERVTIGHATEPPAGGAPGSAWISGD
jgi:hypothetical protein